CRPIAMSIQIAFVKGLDTQSELLWLATHFVERSQTVVNVEHRVLESLRHDRPGELLKFEDEMHVLLTRLRIEVLWESKKQNVAEKIEDRFLHRRIAALGRGDRALDHLSIFVADRLAGREISSINREAGNCFPHRPCERFECEIAIPPIFFRQPVEHVAEHFDFVGQGQSHHQTLLRVNEMPEMHRVSDEPMKSPRHVSFSRSVHENAGDLIGKIVTGRSMEWPTCTKLFR